MAAYGLSRKGHGIDSSPLKACVYQGIRGRSINDPDNYAVSRPAQLCLWAVPRLSMGAWLLSLGRRLDVVDWQFTSIDPELLPSAATTPPARYHPVANTLIQSANVAAILTQYRQSCQSCRPKPHDWHYCLEGSNSPQYCKANTQLPRNLEQDVYSKSGAGTLPVCAVFCRANSD